MTDENNEANNESRPVLNLTELESKIMFLKRRAAEADFLREERDLLLSRLRLCSDDTAAGGFILPEQSKDIQAIQTENEELRRVVETLDETIAVLEGRVGILEKENMLADLLREENIGLKEGLTQMARLEEEKARLEAEKEGLKEVLEDALKVVSADDPSAKCKKHIQVLCKKVDDLRVEKETLQDALIKKQVKVDVLQTKISQLQDRRQEVLHAAQTKSARGLALSLEDEVALSVHRLESANRAISEDLQDLTKKLEAARLAGPSWRGGGEQKRTSAELFMPHQQETSLEEARRLRKTKEEHASFRDLEVYVPTDFSDTFVTGWHGKDVFIQSQVPEWTKHNDLSNSLPSIRDHSTDSLRESVNFDSAKRLEIIRSDKDDIDRYHKVLQKLRKKNKAEELNPRNEESFFFDLVEDSESVTTYKRIGSIITDVTKNQ